MTRISTARLVLKRPRPQDKPTLLAAIGDWEVARWLSRVPHPYTEKDADDWLRITSESELNLSIFRHDVLIGGVGLSRDGECDYYELGYWLARVHWRQGYATEAAKALLDYAAEALQLQNFASAYIKGNEQSARVLKKLGFEEIGEGELYSLANKRTLPCVKLVRHERLRTFLP